LVRGRVGWTLARSDTRPCRTRDDALAHLPHLRHEPAAMRHVPRERDRQRRTRDAPDHRAHSGDGLGSGRCLHRSVTPAHWSVFASLCAKRDDVPKSIPRRELPALRAEDPRRGLPVLDLPGASEGACVGWHARRGRDSRSQRLPTNDAQTAEVAFGSTRVHVAARVFGPLIATAW
jgi:hypothetical protein